MPARTKCDFNIAACFHKGIVRSYATPPRPIRHASLQYAQAQTLARLWNHSAFVFLDKKQIMVSSQSSNYCVAIRYIMLPNLFLTVHDTNKSMTFLLTKHNIFSLTVSRLRFVVLKCREAVFTDMPGSIETINTYYLLPM